MKLHNLFVCFLFAASPVVGDIIDTSIFLNGTTLQTDGGTQAETFRSNTITHSSGATYRVLFTATANVGTVEIVSGDLGVSSSMTDSDQFDATTDSVTFSGLALTDFMANASGVLASDVSILGFTHMSFSAAGASTDRGEIDGLTWVQPSGSDVLIDGAPKLSTSLTHVSGTWRLNTIGIRTSVAVPEPSAYFLLCIAGVYWGIRHSRVFRRLM